MRRRRVADRPWTHVGALLVSILEVPIKVVSGLAKLGRVPSKGRLRFCEAQASAHLTKVAHIRALRSILGKRFGAFPAERRTLFIDAHWGSTKVSIRGWAELTHVCARV